MDDSITIADKKRDYMQFLDNVLVIGGEDKPVRSEMRVAQLELFSKHKGANAALYGDLGYIIMIATAGECVTVFALDVRQGAQLQPLVEQFEVHSVCCLSFDFLWVSSEQDQWLQFCRIMQHHNTQLKMMCSWCR